MFDKYTLLLISWSFWSNELDWTTGWPGPQSNWTSEMGQIRVWRIPGRDPNERGCPLKDEQCLDKQTGRKLANSPGGKISQLPSLTLSSTGQHPLSLLKINFNIWTTARRHAKLLNSIWGPRWRVEVPESPARVACSHMSVRICVCAPLSCPSRSCLHSPCPIPPPFPFSGAVWIRELMMPGLLA